MTLRWTVAILGIPLVLALLYVSGWVLAVPLAALAGLGTHEVYRMAEEKGVRPIVSLGVVASALLVLTAARWPGFSDFSGPALVVLVTLVGAGLLTATFWRGPGSQPMETAAATVLGVAYVGLALAVVPLLHNLPVARSWVGLPPDRWAGVLAVALPLSCTWLGDAAAFFAGKAWGDKRLAPEISPNKSWVGAWAGVLGASVGATLWYAVADSHMVGLPVRHPLVAAGIGALLGVGAILGDLVESSLKREAGVKDSGSVLPGHGGVLDRLDALIFTVPMAYALLLVLDGGP